MKPVSADFIEQFNSALKSGIESIPKLKYILPQPKSDFNLETYFTDYISYELDQNKLIALERFLKEAFNYQDTDRLLNGALSA